MRNNLLANSLAVTTAILYVSCVILVLLVPDLYISVMQSWFHGLDLSKIVSVNVTAGSFFTGLITITGAAWATGYLFNYVNSFFAKNLLR
ncbi:hypothetical protein HY085_03255 [Candidatus Gottesmanbacteria bacterium]|nr:hypothetical protein [Candidatus Gottesmanbacteria bacterium]